MDAWQYSVARLTRLYSVVLPALLLTALLIAVGRAFHPLAYVTLTRDHDGLRFPLYEPISSIGLVAKSFAADERPVLVARL